MNDFGNPRIAGVRLSMLVHLYRVRLRSHAIQELLAGSGIAVGVALVLGVLVANTSLTSSAGELSHEVAGSARLALSARSPEGFPESIALAARRLPGVEIASPVLRQNVAVAGADGHRQAVQLLGVLPSVTKLGGLDAQGFGPGGFQSAAGLVLPASVARGVGVHARGRVTVLARGHAQRIAVGATLGSPAFGALASSPVAITLLQIAQQLTGLRGRVTEVLVEPKPGQDAAVARELHTLAGTRLEVTDTANELRLLNEAARPNDQSTSLFAAISVMVGFLLALNAMLLTVPERRRFVADLRMQGYDWRQILVLLGFQAVVLGVIASAVGIALGDLLSHAFFHRIPAYLTTAFPIGSNQVLHLSTVLIALGCGVLATLIASLSPALDLRPSNPTDAVFRDRGGGSEVLSGRTAARLSIGGVLLAGAITAMVLLEADLTILGGVLLALATVLVISGLFAGVAQALRWLGERVRSSALIVTVSELRAITTRAVALAGVAALAVYGSVAIGGARADLLRGLDVNFYEYLHTADVWVTTGGNDLTTNSFEAPGAVAALDASPDVESVRIYQGGFLDVGPRRMWIIGRPATDREIIPSSQIITGSRAAATRRIREGGWAAVSSGFAGEAHLRVGSPFSLPTPSGDVGFRVAAVTTNLGWAPGAVIMSSSDYARFWQTSNPTALEVDLKPGVSPAEGRSEVAQALGSKPGLGVQTFGQRREQYEADSHQGLQALSEISTLLLIAAALAVASALSAAIWQRRARLASLKIQGYETGQLWRALLLESAIVLGVGCAVGAVSGLYGHALASRWLRLTTGFPAPFALGFQRLSLTLAVLAIIALAVVALPGLGAARAPARTSFHE
ncbi:MAG TPA: FtsX-like permease family protein [Solirubrobacteraceae bacterium]|nr:FtsX-like permease family protein [Solirubrobacteraceae bacterium]